MDTSQNQLLETQIEWQLHSIEELKNAVQLIEEAKNQIEYALQYNRDLEQYIAFGRYGLDQLLGNGNPYDNSIFDLIETAKKQIEEYKKQIL